MRSDVVKKGPTRAPHRSLFKAAGLTEEELERPLIGIVTSQNDIIPGHVNLDKIVAAAKTGVLMSGGTPLVFPTIGVCDGISMGHEGMRYSLVTRELIADSIECTSTLCSKACQAGLKVFNLIEIEDLMIKDKVWKDMF